MRIWIFNRVLLKTAFFKLADRISQKLLNPFHSNFHCIFRIFIVPARIRIIVISGIVFFPKLNKSTKMTEIVTLLSKLGRTFNYQYFDVILVPATATGLHIIALWCFDFTNLTKFERINRFWPNSIPKFFDGCNIFVCSFRTIARILRKLELPRPFFKKFKIP